MACVIDNQSTSCDSAMQTATGSTVITVGGEFNGGCVKIVSGPDGMTPVEVGYFVKPGSQVFDFAPGQPWMVCLDVQNKKSGMATCVTVSALPR